MQTSTHAMPSGDGIRSMTGQPVRRQGRFILLATILLLASPAASQELDETWTLTVNGQSIQANPDGSFKIPNISAADSFGPGGPGTRPDFLSDDFLRLIGTRTVDGATEYVFSQPFQISQGQSFTIGNLTFTDFPPPLPEKIRIEAASQVLGIGDTTQLTVIATLADGSTKDVTLRSMWTIYRTSNPQIASIGDDGLVSAHSVGTAFITAVNEGATAVQRILVAELVVLTDVEGIAQLEDGSPGVGCSAMTDLGHAAVLDADGFFLFPDVEVPSEGAVTVTVTCDGGSETVGGSSGPVSIVPGGITDVGIIILTPRIQISINFDAGSGTPPSYFESGLTVTSLQTHLHFSGGALRNHTGCCSTPYEFTFGGAPFSVVSLDVVSGSQSFVSAEGATEVTAGLGTHTFPLTGWQDITSFRWNATGSSIIDNLVILAQPGSVASAQSTAAAGSAVPSNDAGEPIDDDFLLP